MLGKDLGIPMPRKYNIPSDVWVLPECFQGHEYEFENVGHTPRSVGIAEDWVEFIRDVADHSLRGQGREFTFVRPLMGKDALDALNGICSFAINRRFQTNLRTGFHLHVDVRDLDYDQLKRMIILNALLEPSLYNYVGNNREENVFCLPWYSAEGIVKDIRALYRANGERLASVARGINSKKYTGCNLDPISRFGSIEFRHLRCTTDKDALIKWINICLRIKEMACSLTLKPRQIIGNSRDLGFWSDALKDQMGHLDYQGFLADIKDKSLPIALDIVNQRNSFGRTLERRPNDKVSKFLQDKRNNQNNRATYNVEVRATPQPTNVVFGTINVPPRRVPPTPDAWLEEDNTAPEQRMNLQQFTDWMRRQRNVNNWRDSLARESLIANAFPELTSPRITDSEQSYRATFRTYLIELKRHILTVSPATFRNLLFTNWLAAERHPVDIREYYAEL